MPPRPFLAVLLVVLILFVSGEDTLAEGSPKTANNPGSDAQALGRALVESRKWVRFATIDDRGAYDQGVAEEFKKGVKAAGGTVVDSITIPLPLGGLENLKREKIQAVFLSIEDAKTAESIARAIKLLSAEIFIIMPSEE